MRRQFRSLLSLMLIGVIATTGCQPTQPFFAHEDGDLSHYLDQATEMSYPDVDTAILPEAEGAIRPLNVLDPNFDNFWDLSLEETVSLTLQNSKVLRSLGAVTRFGIADALLNRTLGSPTVYDPALSETNTLGGTRPVDRSTGSVFATEAQFQATQQGVEDALSEFDAQFFSSVNYGTTDRPRNVQTGNPFNPVFFEQQTGNFLAALSKKSAGGNIYTLRNRTQYSRNNIPIGIGRALPSDWQTEFEVEAQFPLMRGRGELVNRIPVLLARMNTDISVLDVERGVRDLIFDVENRYWDLYAAYRALETARIGFDSAHATWQNYQAKVSQGTQGRGLEAKAREQYFFFRSQLERAQHDLFQTERNLRWLMGISPTDGRVVRPADEPTSALVTFDWIEIHNEALFRSPELIQQKWRIAQHELELKGAKNQLLPRLNATANYRWLGLGDDLVNADRNGINFPDPGSTAFDELFEGNFQEATLGLEFTPPQFGARRPLAAIRHAEFELVRAKSQLEEMENQQMHLISEAYSELALQHALMVSHFDGWMAAKEDVETSTLLLERRGEDRTSLFEVLQSQRQRAQRQIDYYRALVDYNKAIAAMHFYKGSLLEYNGIQMAEGPWPQKAYWDAVERARERDASYYLHYGWTRPGVISKGPVPQSSDEVMTFSDEGDSSAAEVVPTPQPTPAKPGAGGRSPANGDQPSGESEMEPPMDESPMDESPMDNLDEQPAEPEADEEPVGPVTRRPAGPALHAPTRASNRKPSARRAAEEEPEAEVMPADLEQPIGTGVSRGKGNPLRQAAYETPGLR